jgi:hypothetical protein
MSSFAEDGLAVVVAVEVVVAVALFVVVAKGSASVICSCPF